MSTLAGSYAAAAMAAGAVVTVSVVSSVDESRPLEGGADFRSAVWGPVRALAAGWNPYDPSATGWWADSGVHVAASLHAPVMLLPASPLAALPFTVALAIWTATTVALLWIAAWLLMRPVDPRGVARTAVLGLALTFTGAGESLLHLGQVTALSVLGLALLVRHPRSWAGAAGVALIVTTPQFAVPLSILAVGVGWWTPVWRGWALAAAGSLPIVVVAVVNGDGVAPFLESVRKNLAWAASEGNGVNRADLVGSLQLGVVGTLAGLLAVAVVAVWLRSVDVDEVAVLGMVALSLALSYSMVYSLTLLLAAAGPVVLRGPLRAVHATTGAVVVVTVLLATMILVPLAHGLGTGPGNLWRLATLMLGPLLLAVAAVSFADVAQRGSARAMQRA